MEQWNIERLVRNRHLTNFFIPALARQSASARRRESGNPLNSYGSGLLLEFIPHTDAGQE